MTKQLTNNSQIPLGLAVWLATDEYLYVNDPKQISATSLLKPLKSIVLSMRGNASQSTDILDLIPSKLGTAIHSSVEAAWLNPKLPQVLKNLGYPDKVVNSIRVNPDPGTVVSGDIPVYLEQRVNKEINGYTISGQFDLVIDGSLFDIKSTGTYNYINQSNSQKYIQQASIYHWLNPTIITDEFFSILYVFTDWSSVKAKQETGYPQSRLLAQKFELMSISDTEAFIKAKVKLIDTHWNNEALQLPDCTAEELWMRPSVFKYYKNPDKMDRSTKNFDSFWEANQRYVEDGSVGRVVEVKGEAVFCKYCAARAICSQAASLINEGRLVV